MMPLPPHHPRRRAKAPTRAKRKMLARKTHAPAQVREEIAKPAAEKRVGFFMQAWILLKRMIHHD